MNLQRAVKRKAVLLIIAMWFSGAACLNAAFEETAVGGKPAGLGGIYVSACDDVNSIYHNPAGLALIGRTEFSAQYSRIQMGLTDNSNLGYSFMGVAQPLGRNAGLIGLGWLRFELSGLYNEDTLMLSYAREASFIDKPWARKLNLGVNLKYLRLAYGEDQYTLNALDNFGNATGGQDSLFASYGRSKGAVDFDLGLQYKLAHNYRFGFMIENLTEPNLALQENVSAPLGRAVKLGITHTGKTYLALVDFMFKKFNGSSDWEASPAGEKWVSNNIALRGALNIGSRELVKVSCGIGYKIDSFQVDYAMVYPLSGVQGTMGDHRISVLFRFGPVIRVQAGSETLAQEYSEEIQAHTATKKKLQEANAELERLRRDIDEQLSRPAKPVPLVKQALPEPLLPPAAVKTGVKRDDVRKSTAAAAASPVNNTAYVSELNNYRKTAAEMSLPQRLSAVERIIKKYSPAVSVSEAQQERRVLVNEQKAQEKYFKDSLDYYRNMAKYGIKKEEKTDILKRMISKYKTMGVDVSEAQKELERVQGQ